MRSPAFVWSHLSQHPTSPVRSNLRQKTVTGQENCQDDSSPARKSPNLSLGRRKTSMELYQHFYSVIVCSSRDRDLFEENAEHPFTQQ